MTPVKMETTSDCFRACLASMLDVPLHEVVDLSLHTPAGQVFTAETLMLLQDWMLLRGLYPIFMPIITPTAGSMSATLYRLSPRFSDIHVMLTGLTRKGVAHAVLVKGGRVVHDPAPVAQGDLEPFSIQGGSYYQVFLVGKAL